MLFHIDMIGRRRRAGGGEEVRTMNLCRARMQRLLLPPCMVLEWLVVQRAKRRKDERLLAFCLFARVDLAPALRARCSDFAEFPAVRPC